MFIKKLKLINFKNYRKQELEFSDENNIIFGDNAQGKTNLIEAIYYLSTLSLFRAIKPEEIISYNEKRCDIYGTVVVKGIEKEYSIQINENKRIQKINNKRISNIKDYFGDFFCIAYTPGNINLIDGYPSIRRKYFDRSIFNHNLSFIDVVSKYNRIVSERNHILKNRFNSDQFDLFTELLIVTAARYICERIKFTKKINKCLKDTYKEFFKIKGEIPEVIYRFCVEADELQKEDEIAAFLEKKFKELYKEEQLKRKTLVGPHLDDYEFYINEKNIKKFSSQGQKKSFLLALKLTESKLLEEKKPIFFVDDFTSELDLKRRENLLDYIQHRKRQCFITTTDINYLPDHKGFKYAKYKVANGEVIC